MTVKVKKHKLQLVYVLFQNELATVYTCVCKADLKPPIKNNKKYNNKKTEEEHKSLRLEGGTLIYSFHKFSFMNYINQRNPIIFVK